MCAQVNLPSTSTAVGFVSFFGGSWHLSNIFLTCLLGFPTVRLPRVFVTTVRHLVWFIEEPNIDDQGLEKETKFFHQKFVPCKNSWYMHPTSWASEKIRTDMWLF